MRRLDLDLIALPRPFPQQFKIANKVPLGSVELTELGRVLDDLITHVDAPVTRGDSYQPLVGLG